VVAHRAAEEQPTPETAAEALFGHEEPASTTGVEPSVYTVGIEKSSPALTKDSAVGMSAAASDKLSPWEVLGWLLVGIVPAMGLLAMGLLVYRHISLTQAQSKAARWQFHIAGAADATLEEEDVTLEEPFSTTEETALPVRIEDYLDIDEEDEALLPSSIT
jgi:hypothetical protein